MTKTDFLKCECRHCAGHIEFPAGSAGETIPCPHCGQPTLLTGATREAKKSTRFPLMFWGIAFLVVIAAAGFILLKKPGPAAAPAPAVSPATNQPPAAPPGEITTTNSFGVSAIQLEKTPGSSLVYVTGTIRNLTEKERYGVKVVLDLFDANNAATGQATDYHQILEAHGKWHFKALVLESKVASAKFHGVLEDQ